MTTKGKIITSVLMAGGLAVLLYAAFFAGRASSSLGRDEAQMEMAEMELLTISQGVLVYRDDHGAWPSSLAELDKGPNAPYIMWGRGIPGVNPWNIPIQYEPPHSSNGLAVLRSLGKDGKEGGMWSAADIEIRFNHDFYQRSWSNYWASRIKESTRGDHPNN